jgi:ribose-phosphate pyrophosphokinase
MIKVNDIVIEQNHFPDNTLFMRFNPYNENLFWEDGLVVDWHYENDAELFTLICLKKHLDHFFGDATHINLNMPYVPHARMDRVKDSEDVFTLKYFCDVINSLHFDLVFIKDVHSNVAPALLEKVVNLKVTSTIERVKDMCGAQILCYPDEGAMKRYSADLPYRYTFGIKKRNWATGQIERLDLVYGETVKDKDVLIVDDICSKGGTFLHTAKALKEAGANNIYLYVTHCETTVFDGEMISSGLISKIYTTDSIFPIDKQNDIIKIVR